MRHQLSLKPTQYICLTILFLVSIQSQAISPNALQQGIPTLAPMLEKIIPAVVSIRVVKYLSSGVQSSVNSEQMPERVRRYFDALPNAGSERIQQPYATGSGSGVIVDARDGLIVTNHHVVEGASTIMVQLSDGRSMQAKLLGSDDGTDIALLQIEGDDLSEIKFADVSSVQVGDYVVAIGNPFGIGQSVTSGIVSALGRSGISNDRYEDFIQTDAAINLGNSGGALVDMEGNLIGINTAIISGNGGSNGIGFAVPGNMVFAVIEHLKRDGEVRRGLLGVTITDTTPAIVSALNLNISAGALVTSVKTNSAAERAGLEVSDIIVEIAGQSVASGRDLRNRVGLMLQGQEVTLVLYRNGERETLQATIGD
ncbi:MAG: serine endoprotease DegQ [SAR86 cluster bacterium]|uniref:Serine endoprotease DegQ n=1 Tax=SAR86 cluster bacterium TaxID=2030880 RepID=A0A2A5AZP7_9GAMM|nr:MAG: serine endoprotease DegQ [SAR86 cluster bacterium]